MKLIVSFLVLLYGPVAISQVRLVNNSLTDSTKTLLYIGIDNDIQLLTPKGKTGNYKLIATGAKATVLSPDEKKENSSATRKYIIRVGTAGDCKLVIQHNGKTVWQKIYRAEETGYRSTSIAGLYTSNAEIDKATLLANPVVMLDTLSGSYWKHGVIVTAFSVTYAVGDSILFIRTIGNTFSPEQIKQIQESKSGDLITLESIEAIDSKGWKRKLPGLNITIR